MDDKRMNDDIFDYNYSAPNGEEKRWIESIRRQYLPVEEHDAKIAEIKALHKRAKTLPTLIAVLFGIAGTLILGTGMAMTLKWNAFVGGIIVGIIGMVIMLLTYPLYQFLRERGKNKYGDRIVHLTDELSVEGEQNATARPTVIDVKDDGDSLNNTDNGEQVEADNGGGDSL